MNDTASKIQVSIDFSSLKLNSLGTQHDLIAVCHRFFLQIKMKSVGFFVGNSSRKGDNNMNLEREIIT